MIRVEVTPTEAIEIIDMLNEARQRMEWVPPVFDEIEQAAIDIAYPQGSATNGF